jgi:hypothetical protein
VRTRRAAAGWIQLAVATLDDEELQCPERAPVVRAAAAGTRSGGRPPAGRREHRIRFWAVIACGASSVDAATEAGVLPTIGVRWFCKGGGMASLTLAPVSGRDLSLRSGRRSRSCSHLFAGCERSRISWVVRRRRFPESRKRNAATPKPPPSSTPPAALWDEPAVHRPDRGAPLPRLQPPKPPRTTPRPACSHSMRSPNTRRPHFHDQGLAQRQTARLPQGQRIDRATLRPAHPRRPATRQTPHQPRTHQPPPGRAL